MSSAATRAAISRKSRHQTTASESLGMSIIRIAKALGVSKSTVWRAIKGSSDINPETRERILQALPRLGYQPNTAARALVTGKSGLVTLWVPSLSTSHVAHVLRHAQEQISRHCFEMIVRSREAYHSSDPLELMQWPSDGILACDVIDVVEMLRPFLTSGGRRTPLVSFGPYCATNVDAVGVDLRQGAVAAVRHLVEAGCRSPVYIVPENFMVPEDARYEGYHAAMAEAGMVPRVIATRLGTKSEGRRVMLEVYPQSPFDGAFCFSDEISLGVYRGLHELGLKAPDDVAIVGCDGIEETEYAGCPLSTLQQPFEEMCRVAWEFLETRMKKPDSPLQFRMLQPELIVRQSSRR